MTDDKVTAFINRMFVFGRGRILTTTTQTDLDGYYAVLIAEAQTPGIIGTVVPKEEVPLQDAVALWFPSKHHAEAVLHAINNPPKELNS